MTRRTAASAERRSRSPQRAAATRFTGARFSRHTGPALTPTSATTGRRFTTFSLNDGTPEPSEPREGLTRNTQQFNQIGGSIGGPLWKDHLFAFFAYETERNNSTDRSSSGWFETSAFEGLAPSGSIASTFLGFAGGAPSSSGIIDQTCTSIGLVEGVTCITIPGQGLNIGSPLKQPLGTQDLGWQSASTPGVGGGLDPNTADIADYAIVNPTNIVDEQYSGRLDANVGAKDRLSSTIYWVPVSQTHLNGAAREYNLWHHSAVNDAFSGIWNHTFSPNFLNEARANAAGWRWNEISSNPQAPFGLPSDSVNAIGTDSPCRTSELRGRASLTSGLTATAMWLHGSRSRHSIKFGGELTRLYYLNEAPYNARPNFNFFNIWDFLNDAPQSESGTFDPTTGTPTAARQDNRENLWGVFVQDDWKVKPSLTLNLGLRYSYFGPLYAKQNNMFWAQFGSGSDMLTGLTVHKGGDLWNAQKGNFGPQFGFAWTPGFYHQRVVIRGGFGLNYNQNEIAITGNVSGNPGLTVSPNFTMNLPTDPNPGIVYQIPSDSHSLFGYPPNSEHHCEFRIQRSTDLEPGKRNRVPAQHADDVYGTLVTRYADRPRRSVHFFSRLSGQRRTCTSTFTTTKMRWHR